MTAFRRIAALLVTSLAMGGALVALWHATGEGALARDAEVLRTTRVIESPVVPSAPARDLAKVVREPLHSTRSAEAVKPPFARASGSTRSSTRTTLHVIDAATRAPLQSVRLAVGPANDSTVGGGGWRVVERDLASPMTLDRARLFDGSNDLAAHERNDVRVWATAPGYAWQHAVIDLAVGGTTEVALEPGAPLVVEVLGGKPEMRLAVRSGSGRGAFTALLEGDSRVRFEGVPVGEVEVEVVAPYPSPRALAALFITLGAAGETVEFDLSERPEPELQRITGTVRLPEEWGEPEGHLLVWEPGRPKPRARLALDELAHDGRTLRFDLDPVERGAYELELDAYCVRVPVPDADATAASIDLVVPAPARVVVRTIDAATGEAPARASLRWTHSGAPGSPRRARRVEPVQATFELVVPVGQLELTASGGSRSIGRAVVDASRGMTECTIELRPVARIEWTLHDRWGPLAWDQERFRVEVVAVDSDAIQVVRRRPYVDLPAGEYELRIGLEGSGELLATRRVTARADRVQRVAFDVEIDPIGAARSSPRTSRLASLRRCPAADERAGFHGVPPRSNDARSSLEPACRGSFDRDRLSRDPDDRRYARKRRARGPSGVG